MNAQPKTMKPILKLGQRGREVSEDVVHSAEVQKGFTMIPNELLEAILQSGILGWKGSYLLATVLKTLSWRKKCDWFTHSQVCEMMKIEPTKYHINQLSAARKALIKEQILFEKGKNTGVNLSVFEWKMVLPEKVGISRKSREVNPVKVGIGYPEKVGNTKETITKEKINKVTNVTLSSADDRNQNPQAVVFAKHSAESLSPVKAISPPKAVSPPRRSKSSAINYQAIVDLYNEANDETGTRLPKVVALNEKRKRAIKSFLKSLKEPSLEMAGKYFGVLFDELKPFHLGENNRGWVANFDYVIRPDVVLRVREGAL